MSHYKWVNYPGFQSLTNPAHMLLLSASLAMFEVTHIILIVRSVNRGRQDPSVVTIVDVAFCTSLYTTTFNTLNIVKMKV